MRLRHASAEKSREIFGLGCGSSHPPCPPTWCPGRFWRYRAVEDFQLPAGGRSVSTPVCGLPGYAQGYSGRSRGRWPGGDRRGCRHGGIHCGELVGATGAIPGRRLHSADEYARAGVRPDGRAMEYPAEPERRWARQRVGGRREALSRIRQLIPSDEMLETMYAAGKHLPIKLRETALGGCAATLSACERCGHCG